MLLEFEYWNLILFTADEFRLPRISAPFHPARYSTEFRRCALYAKNTYTNATDQYHRQQSAEVRRSAASGATSGFCVLQRHEVSTDRAMPVCLP